MKRFRVSLPAAGILLSCFYCATVNAVDMRFSGFFNAVANKHDGGDFTYLNSVENSWSFNETAFGINILSKIDDNLSVAAQLIGGQEGDGMFMDWAFATYAVSDESKIKMGKIKYPGNIFSETVDVGFVYPWVHAPESIYSEHAELFFESFKGGSYKYTAGEDTEFTVEAYYGAIDGEEEGNIVEGHKRMVGVVVTAANEMGQVKFSYNDSTLINKTTAGVVTPGVDGKHRSIIALGAEAEFGDAHIYAEIAQSELEDNTTQDAQGWYVTFTYDIDKWKPVLTFQEFTLDGNDVQSGISLGLNRQLGGHAVVKLEYEVIDNITNNGFFDPSQAGVPNIVDGSSINFINIALNIVF